MDTDIDFLCVVGVTLWTFIYCCLPLILGLYIFEEWEVIIVLYVINGYSFVDYIVLSVRMLTNSAAWGLI